MGPRGVFEVVRYAPKDERMSCRGVCMMQTADGLFLRTLVVYREPDIVKKRLVDDLNTNSLIRFVDDARPPVSQTL